MVGVRIFEHFNPTQRRKHDFVKSRYNKNGQQNLQNGVLKSNDGRHVHFVDLIWISISNNRNETV